MQEVQSRTSSFIKNINCYVANYANYLSVFFCFSKISKPFQTYYPFATQRGGYFQSRSQPPTVVEFSNNLRSPETKWLPCASERSLTLHIVGKWRLFRETALQSVYFLHFILTAESWIKVVINFQWWNQMNTFKWCSQSNQNSFWVNSNMNSNGGWGESCIAQIAKSVHTGKLFTGEAYKECNMV